MMCENNVRFNMLADFYEFTMSNGYFEKGKRDEIVYFDMFSEKFPTAAVLLSRRDWSRLSTIWKTSNLTAMRLSFCALRGFSARNF